jgi:lipopolysaccharide transport system permease protein
MSLQTWQNRSKRGQTSTFLTLLRALVLRDIRARYRRSILGPLWAILQPLILMVLFNMLRQIVEIPSDGAPYLIFSYSALVPWTFFSNAVIRCGPSVATNAGLVKKMSITREVFPTAAVITALFDLVMSGLVLFVMMLYYDVALTPHLLWLPLLVVITAALAWGVGVGVASLATFKNDFVFATPFLMQVWLYATPVIYPLSSVPEKWLTLYRLNPTVGLIESYRAVIVFGQMPDVGLIAQAAGSTLLICAITWPFFRRMSQYFADVL